MQLTVIVKVTTRMAQESSEIIIYYSAKSRHVL